MKVHFEKKTDFNLYFEMKRYVRIASEISYTFGFIMGPRGKGGFIYQGTRNVSFSQKKKNERREFQSYEGVFEVSFSNQTALEV
jgi:hypothetical protein